MKRVLILFAHPALEKSRVHRVLIQGLQDLESVTLHDLYEAYPEFEIDVRAEQELLKTHDIIVFQHPFFWYSTPSILKEWQDLVLEHGWAYGKQGKALRGKQFLSAVTTGGRETAYRKNGYNRFTMRELLAPIEQTAHLCGMEYLPPFVIHGTHGMTSETIRSCSSDYREVIQALRDGRINMEVARESSRLNFDLGRLIRD